MKENFFKIKSCAQEALLNGIYKMLPFAVCGGILVSLSYLIDYLAGAQNAYTLGSSTPIALTLKTVGSTVFMLMLPVLSAFIALRIGGKYGFICGIAAGFISQTGASFSLPYGDTAAVSGFLGAIAAGFGSGAVVYLAEKVFKNTSSVIFKTAKELLVPTLCTLFVCTLIFIINPLIGNLNTLLVGVLTLVKEASPVLFGAILGIMTIADLGGAISKASFIFATASIATGEYTAIASVMAAGMAGSLSVALCSSVFPLKFSTKEKSLARANYLFGLSFIIEGIIPIAIKDPLKVLPSCILSSAVSGAMCAAFGCTLMTPAGGIFVLPLVGNPIGFIISVFTGTIVGAALLGIIKTNPKKQAKGAA